MKIGTYFAYWANEWKVSYFEYLKRAKSCGFDVLEISTGILELSDAAIADLRDKAKAEDLILTMGFGPPKEYDMSSSDDTVRRKGIEHMKRIFDVMDKADIRKIGGALYAYWPADYSDPIDKPRALEQSIKSMKELADAAHSYAIELNCEVLNRFEQYLLNDAAEGLAFVKAVDKPNVKVMLDTFHMNIEEDDFASAIRSCKDYLGHFHIGEANRKVPRAGRMPWAEIAQALKDIAYDGYLVMEPFVSPGGGVGKDIKVWRDLSGNADAAKLDKDIADSVQFVRKVFS